MEHRQFANDSDGLFNMTDWISGRCSLVVFEASGIYHRELETHLSNEVLPYSKVNPRQARRFAQAMGKIAKTDKIDAEVLAKMGAVLRLPPQDPKNEYINALREIMTARRGLIKDRVAVRTRMRTTTQTLLKRLLKERLAQVEKHLEQLDSATMKLISDDEQFLERLNILKSIPGISDITATAMLVEMPELGTMNGLCCTNPMMGRLPLSPDGFILRVQ